MMRTVSRYLAGAMIVLTAGTVRADITALDFMTGCWSAVGKQPGSGEQWMRPAGGMMLGVNRTVRDGKTVAWEYLRIVEEDDGIIALIASPSGQSSARFEMIEMAKHEVVFENPDHDFPQRIIYRLDAAGNLNGRIEGKIDGNDRGVDFPMQKIACGKL